MTLYKEKNTSITQDMPIKTISEILNMSYENLENITKEEVFILVDEFKIQKNKLQNANNNLKKLKKQLLHVYKLISFLPFIDDIIHDFNNILHIIIGYGILLKKYLPAKQSKEQDFIEKISSAAKRGNDLTKQLITSFKETDGKKKHQDMRNIINDSLKILRSILPSSVKIETSLSSKPCMVFVNKSQIYQLFFNLCIKIGEEMDRDGTLNIDLQIKKKNIELIISNSSIINCIPFTTKTLDAFFEKDLIDGTVELGLSVMQGIVENHHGHIEVSNEKGKGKVCHILFPLIEN